MRVKTNTLYVAMMLTLIGVPGLASAGAFVQCPGDEDGDAIIDPNNKNKPEFQNIGCDELTGSDGWVTMADGKLIYIFGFGPATGTPPEDVMSTKILNARAPAPLLVMKEGQKYYLTLTNTGTVMRPDLFDPHTVHYHGFPNASSYFDGVPENTTQINPGASFTYFYNNKRPGTYMYHCHVEAAEHMQMGMLGNLYVTPKQNGTDYTFQGKQYDKFVYNDGDGSTGYDVEFPLQLGGFDSNFHEKHINVQPLPFAEMYDTYPLINGRGYPDTVNRDPLPPPAEAGTPVNGDIYADGNLGVSSQTLSSLVKAVKGQRILLRLSNLSVTDIFSISIQGLPVQVVGKGASQLKGPNGDLLYYNTSTLTLGGGEAKDLIIDTSDPNIKAGTYYLFTTNLKYLSNDMQDYGGMMTKIVISDV